MMSPMANMDRLERIVAGLPEAERVDIAEWGDHPTFRVRNKLFAMYAAPNNHHGGGRPAVWCKAAPGNQALMVRGEPGRYFVPPYVGPSGWVGVWLDRNPDWSEVQELMSDSYKLVAPKRLAALVGGDE